MHQDHFWNLLAKKLAGEASAEEVEELAALLKHHPELSYAAEHVSNIWKLKATENASAAEKAFLLHLARIEAQKATADAPDNNESDEPLVQPKSKKLKIAALLLIFVLAAATGIVIWNNNKQPQAKANVRQTEEIFTRPGTRTKLVLPDSSVVWLNAGSKLTYSHPFGQNDRTVSLTGEAFFDVVKSEKPFIIHASGVQIRVLGTAFNVRNYPNEKKIETSLIRGRVEITVDKSPGDKYTLMPNEKLTLNTASDSTKKEKRARQSPTVIRSTINYLDSNTVAETSWVENKLVFDDESFEEIARKMERWYGYTIRFENEKVKKERLSGEFEKESIWQALSALQETTPFHYKWKNNEIVITH